MVTTRSGTKNRRPEKSKAASNKQKPTPSSRSNQLSGKAGMATSDVPSCYVIEASIQPGGGRRWDRFVFGSKEDLKRWLDLEFKFPFCAMLALSYGEDVFLSIYQGRKLVHRECLLKRVKLVVKGIPFYFRNIKPCDEEARNEYYDDIYKRKIPRTSTQTIDGKATYVYKQMGGDTIYEIHAAVDDCHGRCLCGGDDPCKGNIFDCQTYECEIDLSDKSEFQYEVRGIDDKVLELPSRGLKSDERIERAEGAGGRGKEDVIEEPLELGFFDLENGEAVEKDWSAWPYNQEW